MNRRNFTKKAAGVLAAIGAAIGVKTKAKADSIAVEYNSDEWAKGVKMPPGKTRLFTGYKLELHRCSEREGVVFMVCHYSVDERGSWHGDHFPTRNPDTAAWEKMIGTFY